MLSPLIFCGLLPNCCDSFIHGRYFFFSFNYLLPFVLPTTKITALLFLSLSPVQQTMSIHLSSLFGREISFLGKKTKKCFHEYSNRLLAFSRTHLWGRDKENDPRVTKKREKGQKIFAGNLCCFRLKKWGKTWREERGSFQMRMFAFYCTVLFRYFSLL